MITALTAVAALVAYLVGVNDSSPQLKSAILVIVAGVIIQVIAGAIIGVQ